MTFAGARGETRAQMSRTLRFHPAFDPVEKDASSAFADLLRALNEAGGARYEMVVASSLWSQVGAPLLSGFLDLVARCYGGAATLVDFRDAEAACSAINDWIAEKTKGRIRDLISAGGLGGDTRLVVVNAVYFKGMWALPFRRSATRDEPFHVRSDHTVKAPLMHRKQEARYLQAEGYQAVELAYQGGDLSMLVLLPDATDGLPALEKGLTERVLRDTTARMLTQEVDIFLPRFRLTWGVVEMSESLSLLGMPLAFERGKADFSGINGRVPPDEEALSISAILHKAFVEVNEEGTEAAAATAVEMVALSAASSPAKPPPVPIFRADHPFLFAIRERGSGAILFLGRVVDPTRKS
ncbi:proteinase inhibitor I4 serpin [Minicystis rosea]|nr:proteinase inhibitor I4 serpin [Minicystis rosea]